MMKIRLLAALLIPAAVFAQTIVIHNARVVDGTGAPAVVATVVIRDGRIAAVAPDAAIPAGARVVEAAGRTLLPGLFDLHTHARASAAPTGSTLAGDWPKDLAAYLVCGVTSIDDFGNYGEQFEPMRRLLSTGAVAGPRVHLAARISPPEGHGTEGGQGDMFTLEAATPEQAHFVMQKALAWRPDVIKVFTDGWRYGASPALASMNEETIAAIVADAHRAGLKVLTHTVSLENARITVRAGVDSLVHGVQDRDLDEDFLALMKSKGTAYVSTLAVYEPRNRLAVLPTMQGLLEPAIVDLLGLPRAAAARRTEPGAEPTIRPAERWAHLLHNERALFAAGIPIGNGTDAGMGGVYHGWASLHEMELATQAGLTPLQAITAATLTSARILGADRELGSIQPGKLADLVLIDGRPDEQIGDIYKTARVFLGGREFDPAVLRALIQSDGPTPLPARAIEPLLDDFERPDGRTALGTLRIYSTDPGIDHSRMLFTVVPRADAGHNLLIQAAMGPKQRNYVRLHLPLTPGGIEPADLSRFHGIALDARGEGDYTLGIATAAARTGDFHARFQAGSAWKTVKLDFADFDAARPETARQATPPAWTGRDAREIWIELAGPAGSARWLEVDNLTFY